MPLARAVAAERGRKALVAVFLGLVYCMGYVVIERYPVFRPIRFPLLAIDRRVAFSPRWVWAYESIYPLLMVALLGRARGDIARYATGFIIVMGVGFSVFLLFPVQGPRPPIFAGGGLYRLQTTIDTPLNSFPSMHIALATYSACVGIQCTSGVLRRRLAALLPAWVLCIGYSALATKQHYAVDLPAGALLGWAGQRLAWRLHRTGDRSIGRF